MKRKCFLIYTTDYNLLLTHPLTPLDINTLLSATSSTSPDGDQELKMFLVCKYTYFTVVVYTVNVDILTVHIDNTTYARRTSVTEVQTNPYYNLVNTASCSDKVAVIGGSKCEFWLFVSSVV